MEINRQLTNKEIEMVKKVSLVTGHKHKRAIT